MQAYAAIYNNSVLCSIYLFNLAKSQYLYRLPVFLSSPTSSLKTCAKGGPARPGSNALWPAAKKSRLAAQLPRKCLEACRPGAKKNPAGPVWRENPFPTTSATLHGRGFHQENARRPHNNPPKSVDICRSAQVSWEMAWGDPGQW
jgi:hypothetical protein